MYADMVYDFFARLKKDRKVDHFEELINFSNYPEHMCGRLDHIKDMFSDITQNLRDCGNLERPEDPGYDAEDWEQEEYDEALYVYEKSVQDLHSEVVNSYYHVKSLIDEIDAMYVELDEWVSELYGSGRDYILANLRVIAEGRGHADFVDQIDSSLNDFDNYYADNFVIMRRDLNNNYTELFDEFDVVEELCNSRTIEDDMAYYECYVNDGRLVESFRSAVEDYRSLGSSIREEIQILMYEADVTYGIVLEEYA